MTTAVVVSRLCTGCHQDKWLDEFHVHKYGTHGRASRCIECTNEARVNEPRPERRVDPGIAHVLEEPIRYLDWAERAACRGIPNPDVFFPGPYENTTRLQEMCGECPVRQQCLDTHIGESDGWFGGMSAGQRKHALELRTN